MTDLLRQKRDMDNTLDEEETQWFFFMGYKTHLWKSHFCEDDFSQNFIVH